MRSIGARLSLWYAAAATTTLAILFIAGYYLLETYLIHGLDLLNQSEFNQIKARLGPDYRLLSPAVIDQRIRETTEYASVLFYIDIHGRDTGTIFYSTNLHGKSIPDVKGERKYDLDWGSIGLLRVGEFLLSPYDVMIATSETQVQDVMEGYAEVGAGLLAIMLVMSVVIGLGLSRLALRPVRLIRETASRIGSDNLSERIAVPQVHDEISELALLLNAMFDRLEDSFKHVRRFAADASHELKTPLSLVRLHAEKLLASGALDCENEEELLTILEEVTRLNATIDELLFLSRIEARSITLELAPHDPTALLATFSIDAQVLTEARGLRFSASHAGQGKAIYEPRWLRRVLLNLLSNAVNASPPGGQIRLRSTLDGSRWRVSLEDEGTGVPLAERERIFDRFMRLKSSAAASQEGSGLGLAICRGIIGLHDGRIFAEAGSDGRGLRVVFEIPAEPAAAHAPLSLNAPATTASA
ncbi:MAG: Two-component sensor histidine kinase [Gammaproteobacteria bacterium]|nr:Two-component sensor histidine kinase [Gammaproteobacteria bacterium]